MNNKNPLFILAGNGPNNNRGCEAILRGTVKILRNHFIDPKFLAVTSFNNDEQYECQRLNETDPSIIHKKIYRAYKRYEPIWFLLRSMNLLCPSLTKHILYKDLKPYLNEAKAVLALGGDNYSFFGRRTLPPKICTNLDDLVVSRRKPLVIWGASVGPFDEKPNYEKYIMYHFRKVHILARETATIEYLSKNGLTENVYRVADPAFLMKAVKPEKVEEFIEIEDGAVGLNLSPLLTYFVEKNNSKQWKVVAAGIINRILEKTGRKLFLIPHVSGPPHNDDYTFMKSLFPLIKNHERIVLVPPIFDAPEIKWIISKMTVFAGARTHSTIASLSSCVPTLSFAYSMKSKGLNRDIYGHHDYCIPTDELTPEVACEKIEVLLQESTNIKRYLQQQLPKIEDLAMSAGSILKNILKASNDMEDLS